MTPPPPISVLEAFGLSGPPEPLAGGQATVWRVGEAVLKPETHSAEELEWQAWVLGQVSRSELRVSRLLRAHNGAVLVEGWSAWAYLKGRHAPGRWTEILQVGQHFHQALAAVPRPAFLEARTDPWAAADRMAWGELPLDNLLTAPHIGRLAQRLRPVEASSQLIHGDLTGNVLFSESDVPAVIDFSAYWRPAELSLAIVVADALVWEEADEGLLEAVREVTDFPQYLLRALIFRRIVEELLPTPPRYAKTADDPYQSAVNLAIRLSSP